MDHLWLITLKTKEGKRKLLTARELLVKEKKVLDYLPEHGGTVLQSALDLASRAGQYGEEGRDRSKTTIQF